MANRRFEMSELIHRIAHKQPQLVERDVTLAVRGMFEQDGGTSRRWRANRDPGLRQLLGAIAPRADRPRPQDRGAGVACGQVRALFQAGQEAARAR